MEVCRWERGPRQVFDQGLGNPYTKQVCAGLVTASDTLMLNVGTELAEAGGAGSAAVLTSQRRETLLIPQAFSLKTHQIHAS